MPGDVVHGKTETVGKNCSPFGKRQGPSAVVGRILDGDKGGVVVAAVVGGTVLAELRAVDPQPQPARARGLYVREIVCVQGRARYRSRRPGFPPHFVLKHGVWHYGMETSGLRRVVLREDFKGQVLLP